MVGRRALAAAARRIHRFPRPLVSLEFDDGHLSPHERGLPLVRSFGWRPTLHAITGEPDASAELPAGELVGPAEVRDWARHGPVGSHTVTHRSLPTLADHELEAELGASRERLEGWAGRAVPLLAAPFGDVDPRVVAAARRCGYGAVRSTGGPPNLRRGFDPFHLRALMPRRSTPIAELAGALDAAIR